jgi:hypothetical protein
MPETNATRLPRANVQKNPEWLDAIRPYKHGFEAGSADTLSRGADEWTELSPDEQAFHQAHLTYRQVQALGAVFGALRRIELRLALLEPDALAGNVETIKKAAVVVARGQSKLAKALAEGGLAGAMRGEDEDDADDDGGEEEADADDDGDMDDDDAVDEEFVEEEDHGNGDAEVVVPEVLPAGARRPTTEGA